MRGGTDTKCSESRAHSRARTLSASLYAPLSPSPSLWSSLSASSRARIGLGKEKRKGSPPCAAKSAAHHHHHLLLPHKHLLPLRPQVPGLLRQGQAKSIATKVYISLIADYGLCGPELLSRCNVEQAPRLTAGHAQKQFIRICTASFALWSRQSCYDL
jgi:hypothetical protein